MRDNDSGSTGHYCQSKNFPRMTKDCIHRANGHQVVTLTLEVPKLHRWMRGMASGNFDKVECPMQATVVQHPNRPKIWGN